ncbi:MAG: hypothetical protein ACKOFM_08100, partial [Actinomycetota bacterium]
MNDISTFVGPVIDWVAISPLLALLAGALVLLLVGSLTGQWPWRLYAHLAALSAVIAILVSVRLWDDVDTNGARLLIGGALA